MFVPYQDHATSLNFSWEKRYVQFFDTKTQIPQYVELWKKLNSELVAHDVDYLAVMRTLPGLSDMITNPFVLWIVISALPKLLKKHSAQPLLERYHLTRLDLFDAFTSAWFERQRDKLLKNGQIDNVWAGTIVEDYKCYCQQLANFMWQNKISSVIYEPQAQWDVFFAPKGDFNDDPNKPLALIRQGALLRILDGKTYAFLHNCLLEYFSAKQLFESAANKASMALGLEINSQLITQDLARIRLGADCVIKSSEFENSLWDIVEESKHEARVEIAAANAITILTAANKSFAGKDLRRIRIRHANLAGGNFDGTNLQESDLRDVNINQVWLNNAKLSSSCVDRVRTGELFSEVLDSEVKSCAFSLNGLYYIAMTKKDLIIYDVLTHKKIKIYSHKLVNTGNLSAFMFSPSSDFVLLGTNEGRLIKVSFPGGEVLKEWKGHEYNVKALAISPDGLWVLTGSIDGSIKKWEIKTGRYCATWLEKRTLILYAINVLSISPDGRWALSGSMDNTIKRWDMQTGQCLSSWHIGSSVNAFAISSDGHSVLSGANDKTIKRWEIETGRCLAAWQGHTGRVLVLALSPDGRWALTGSDDRTVKRWDVDTGLCQSTWSENKGSIITLALSPDGRWAILGTDDNLMGADNNLIKRWEVEPHRSEVVVQDHSDSIIALAISPNSRWALTATNNHSVKRLAIDDGRCQATWQGHTSWIRTFALSSDERWALSGSDDTTIKRWDVNTGQCIATWGEEKGERSLVYPLSDGYKLSGPGDKLGHTKGVNAIVLSADGRCAITGSGDYTIKRWDVETGRCLVTWDDTSKIFVLALSSDGSWLLSAKKTIKRWDVQSGRCEATWQGHNSDVNVIVISSDGLWALSGSSDKTIKRWETKSGRCLATWEGHQNSVYTLALSPDGRWALSGGQDCQLLLWETQSGAKRAQFGFAHAILKLCWSTKDPTMVLVSMNGGGLSAWTFNQDTASLHLRWRSKPWELRASGCQLLGTYGLLEHQHQLLVQKGSQVQVSTKSSEGERGILAQRSQIQISNSEHPPHSLFDHSLIIRPEAWVISIARRKAGDGMRHAFLILESIEEGYYRIRRIDFVLEQRHQMLQQEPGTGQKYDIFGQALIEMADKSVFDMQSLVNQCCARTSGITSNQGLKLLENIRKDQSEKIGYCLMGAGAMYRMFRMKAAEEQHNCLSWCEKHLDEIGVNLMQRTWIDGIVNYTPSKLKEEKLKAPMPSKIEKEGVNTNNNKKLEDDEPTSGSKCVAM